MIVPALALVAGVAIGVSASGPVVQVGPLYTVGVATLLALLAWRLPPFRRRLALPLAVGVAGVLHGAHACESALHTPIRQVLEAAVGGFAIETAGPPGGHDPIPLRAALEQDATDAGEFISLRVQARAVRLDGQWTPVSGPLVVTVNGATGRERIADWRAGRLIELPVVFRRPARYLNDGVTDFERDAALSGITLFATVKSGLLVEVVSRGPRIEQATANARAFVRASIDRWVAPHGDLPAAIVTAVLIGDRTGLPDAVRERLQAAGTYHVIAISGGNIAILTALLVGVLTACSLPSRLVSLGAVAGLIGYALVASTGPSVWRATLMAVLYLSARFFDHRTSPWHAMALAAIVIAIVEPLDVRDAGFLLTFGATAGLLGLGRAIAAWSPAHRVTAWVVASIGASLAAELMVLPVAAAVFSRVTAAGLLLNLIAVPAMGVVQIAGMAVVATTGVPAVAALAGWTAAAAASCLVDSARLVDVVPAVARHVPPPAGWIVAVYYAALVAAWLGRPRRGRTVAAVAWLSSAACIASGVTPWTAAHAFRGVRVTMFDVGQGESIAIECDSAGPMLVDAGGSPFGGGAFDIGERVLAPALWSRGIRRLDVLLITHGDPDHLGGAESVIGGFRPRALWWGVPVPRHAPSASVIDGARRDDGQVVYRRANERLACGSARLRVLNPPEPEWERQRVRNDDSVVLELVVGTVAVLLTGDIGADVERAIAPQLTPAGIRILKVAHHGSRTSTSPELLAAWHPQIALISAGRSNTFGHPAPEVVARLESIGARIYRTDRDGQITITTDGRGVDVSTFAGGGG